MSNLSPVANSAIQNPYIQTFQGSSSASAAPAATASHTSQTGSNATVTGQTASGNATPAIATLNAILGQQTASTGSFSQITADARATLNANYAAFQAAGNPINYNTLNQQDLNDAFKGLDRQSLFAIASNSQNLFTGQEQTWAQGIMSNQESTAMGLDNPTLFIQDPSAGDLEDIKFLNSVSAEEKASANWKLNMASLEASYQETYSQNNAGQPPPTSNNIDPVVELLTKLINNAKGVWSTNTNGGYVTDLSKISFFQDPQNLTLLQQAMNQSSNNAQVAQYGNA